MREGSIDAPTRHPLDWKSEDFWDKASLNDELERVFDVCHGCRRCVSLCDAFPTLFDLIDESDTMEVDGVIKRTTTRSRSNAICATSAILRSALTYRRMNSTWTSRT